MLNENSSSFDCHYEVPVAVIMVYCVLADGKLTRICKKKAVTDVLFKQLQKRKRSSIRMY